MAKKKSVSRSARPSQPKTANPRHALLAVWLLAALPGSAVAQRVTGGPRPSSPLPSRPAALNPPPRSGGDPWGNDVVVTISPPSPALALVTQTEAAVDRRAQAFADPWTFTGSAQLFSRPTFGERFKLSSENSRSGTVFSVAASPAALANPLMENRLLWGTQLLATASPDSKEVTLGAKVNYNFGDARGFTSVDLRKLEATANTSSDDCMKGGREEDETNLQRLQRCTDEETKGRKRLLEELRHLKPLVSLGVVGGRNFSTQRWGKFAANLAVELPLWDASLVMNVDAENTELTVDRRRWASSGTLAATWNPTVPLLPNPMLLSVAGKYTACLVDCDPSASTVRFGPTLGYSVTRNTLLEASLTWEARNNTVGDPFLGVALSHSFGLQKNEASH